MGEYTESATGTNGPGERKGLRTFRSFWGIVPDSTEGLSPLESSIILRCYKFFVVPLTRMLAGAPSLAFCSDCLKISFNLLAIRAFRGFATDPTKGLSPLEFAIRVVL